MAPYIFKRNREGIHIINVAKTWEKLMLAARIIAAIPNPADILVNSPIVNHFRLCQAENTPKELSLSSLPTLKPTTKEENGPLEPLPTRTPKSTLDC